ncbi:hypothetical protein BD311DRAFT_767392 [Dichomitus squalens]|uniref:Uncharacterized protein n=1 Tax=Dichomitus squalens TaxID=114155 RepID=A0A4Q9MDS1_9APHY|nr:hypothetical protein BD311DRAFT_767392 [Dichomitus squalens]
MVVVATPTRTISGKSAGVLDRSPSHESPVNGYDAANKRETFAIFRSAEIARNVHCARPVQRVVYLDIERQRKALIQDSSPAPYHLRECQPTRRLGPSFCVERGPTAHGLVMTSALPQTSTMLLRIPFIVLWRMAKHKLLENRSQNYQTKMPFCGADWHDNPSTSHIP